MTVSDADLQASAAANMVAARTGISDLNAALSNTDSMNGDSGVLERLTTLETWDGAFNFAPAACYDSDTNVHYVFVTGTDRKLHYTSTAGGSWDLSWKTIANTGDYWTSAPYVYYYNGYIFIYVAGRGGIIYHANFTCATSTLGAWVNLIGTSGP